jgi:hypothetical protein
MEIIKLAATGPTLQADGKRRNRRRSLHVALPGGGYQATYFEAADGNLHETAARESLGAPRSPAWGTARGGQLPFDAAAVGSTRRSARCVSACGREGAPVALVHHHGHKSGREYVNPVMYLPHDTEPDSSTSSQGVRAIPVLELRRA